MKSWQIVHMIAGMLIVVGIALGVASSPIFIYTWFLAIPTFVGANLLQSAFTRWCLLESILTKLGVERGC